MQQDELDVAILAAQTNGAMNNWYGPQRTRVDPRQFIHNTGGFHPQHPQGNVDEYGLPRSIPAQPVQTLPMIIRGRDGQLIDLNQVIGAQEQPSYQPSQPNVENFQDFQVPNYSPNTSSPKNSKKPTEHPFDTILKEIKSLKKSVNKLIREVESSKLTKSESNIINEVTSKSTNISERILVSPIGDE